MYYSNDHFLVTLRLIDDSVIELPLKEYLMGVLATSLLPIFNIEVLKAICILYRTYAFYKISTDKEIHVSNDFVLYKPISYYKLVWTNEYEENAFKIEQAIKDTDCLFLTYNGKYVLPFIHYSNTGRTFQHRDYPYLSSVKSLWDLASQYFIEVKEYSFDSLSKILDVYVDKSSKIKILDVDGRDYVTKLSIAEKIFSGEELKQILNLKSMNISIIINKDSIKFISKGYGNGYGLSLYGANELAVNGCDFANILHYYFPKTKINKYIKELS